MDILLKWWLTQLRLRLWQNVKRPAHPCIEPLRRPQRRKHTATRLLPLGGEQGASGNVLRRADSSVAVLWDTHLVVAFNLEQMTLIAHQKDASTLYVIFLSPNPPKDVLGDSP